MSPALEFVLGGHHAGISGSSTGAGASPRSGKPRPPARRSRRARPGSPHGASPRQTPRPAGRGPVRRPSEWIVRGTPGRFADWRRRRPGNTQRPPASAAIDSNTGDNCLQGSHQVAHRSTTTSWRVDRSMTSASNVTSVTSMTGPSDTGASDAGPAGPAVRAVQPARRGSPRHALQDREVDGPRHGGGGLLLRSGPLTISWSAHVYFVMAVSSGGLADHRYTGGLRQLR